MDGRTNGATNTRGLHGVIEAERLKTEAKEGGRKEGEEIAVAQAILAVTKAMESVPESQIPNVFYAVNSIFATARGKQIDVQAEMKEIAIIREQLEGMRRDQGRQHKRGWLGRG